MITAKTPVEQLPSDVETLQRMILQLLADVNDKARTIVDLKGQLEYLKRHVFGRRSEKLDPNQRLLFEGLFEQLESHQQQQQTEVREPQPVKSRRKNGNHKGRRPLPADLPREKIEIHPPQEQQQCPDCESDKEVIGQEVTEVLEYKPASFFVRQYVRYKYACSKCGANVSIGELPARAIDKGLPGEGLLAHVITSKYTDHLPLNRLEGIFKRHDIDINVSTMCDWVGHCAKLLEPIVKRMHEKILQSPKINTDDTPVLVKCRNRKGTYKGYLWAYIDDSNNVVFDFTPTRSRAGPLRFLGDYSGYVQADAYSGYDEFFRKGQATEVGCWSHTRRKFFDAKETDPARAGEMLALIGGLYEIERDAKERKLNPEEIVELRRCRAKPILEMIEGPLGQWHSDVLPKSPIGKAVTYAINQWQALNVYVDVGMLDIDNNSVERVLRMVAIGRKNWLFAGSEAGAQRAAIIYSLVASCKLNGIDPFKYFRAVLAAVSVHPISRIDELLPSNWKSHRQLPAE